MMLKSIFMLAVSALLLAAVNSEGAGIPLPAATMYADALAKEQAVRTALTNDQPIDAVLKAVRTVVTDYQNIVRIYPTSGYCDDALWQAGRLAFDAFEKFGDAREKAAATKLLQALSTQYPASKFARQTPTLLAKLGSMPVVERPAAALPESVASRDVHAQTPPVRVATPPPASQAAAPSAVAAPVVAPPAQSQQVASQPTVASQSRQERTAPSRATSGSAPTALATIRDIQGAVLKESVRVTIELDREVPFREERLENPVRYFVDLTSTRPAPQFIDQTLSFNQSDGSGRNIRVGRHRNNVTRVVLDAAGTSHCGAYPLYAPYRLVIECLQTIPTPVATAGVHPSTIAARPLVAANVRTLPAPPMPAPLPRPQATAIRARRITPLWTRTLPKATAANTSAIRNARVAEARDDAATAAAASLPVPAARVTPAPVAIAPIRPPTNVTPPPTPGSTSAATSPAPPAAASTASPIATAPLATPALPPPVAVKPPARNVAGGFSVARQLGLGVSRIVIDPGHGGHDPGAKGRDVSEAELVLDIALRLEELLQATGVNVTLTRRTDAYVSLQERTAIANRSEADLFLSIHANASSNTQARGVETYFLNFAKTVSAQAVAARENAASAQAMGDLTELVKAITMNSKVDESRDLATMIQRAMVEQLRGSNKLVRDLGVKQAPFMVLIGAQMPSVLTEISFLTNAQDARLLRSSEYRQQIAEALMGGIQRYQRSLKSVNTVAKQP